MGGEGDGAARGELVTVKGLDLGRYMGRWYEIARIPSRFQPKQGENTRATYSLNSSDGSVAVLNETWVSGQCKHISGRAWKKDAADDAAKLLVRFWLPPFLPLFPVTGDYWVMALDEQDYQWALVGQPSRKYLWVLSRRPQLSEEIYRKLMEVAMEQGYDTSLVEKTKHTPDSESLESGAAGDGGVWWIKSIFGK